MIKRVILFIITHLCALTIFAQNAREQFTELPASEYPITVTTMPTFSTQIPVAENFILSDVYIEFPELQALNKKEVECLKAQNFKPPYTPELHKTTGVSRKQKLLNLEFIPLVERNGKWFRITSVKIAITSPTLARQMQKNSHLRYADNSVLAQGKWVKIRVEKEGIYELTNAKLKDLGFSSPEKVKLYGYGGLILPEKLEFTGQNALIDDLCEQPLYRKTGSVVFFAEGTIRIENGVHKNNHYSRYSYYFLTEGEAPLAWNTVVANPNSTTPVIKEITSYAILDNDAVGWYGGGTDMYDSYDFINGNQRTFKLHTPNLADSKARIDIGFSAANTLARTNAEITINNSRLGTISVSSYDSETEKARETRMSFTTSALQSENSLQFTTTPGHHARLNYIRIAYTRTLSANDTPFSFAASTAKQDATIKIENADANTQLWQIGNGQEPIQRISTTLEGTTLSATVADASRRFIWVNLNQAFPAPEIVGNIENQNLHAEKATDMVIIIPESNKLAKEAARIAEMHKTDGLRVTTVRADQLYNEFSSGTPDATAYRRFLKMLYDQAQIKDDFPKYLLLFGDCAWDNRMLSEEWKDKRPEDFLLAYEVSQTAYNSISIGTLNSFVTDDYFGMLDDGEGANLSSSDLLDLAIGRFLCHTEETAKILVDKTISYKENQKVGAWKNRIVFMADYGDRNLHMYDTERVTKAVEQVTNDRFIIDKVYWDTYTITPTATGNSFPQATKLLQQRIKEGALLFNYTGHGSPELVSHAQVLKISDYEKPTLGNMPLLVFASCEITPYDMQTSDIGRAALYNTRGGAMAVMCASRSVYANYNNSINIAFSQQLFSKNSSGQYQSIGEALRLAKIAIIKGGTDRTMNKLKYALLGDPALKLTAPEGIVTLDSINGTPLTATSKIQLKAGQKVRFSGFVSLQNSTIDETFNGTITGTLFDRKETIEGKNNMYNGERADEPIEFKAFQTKLYEGRDSVRNGRFSLLVTIPYDINYTEERGRLYLYAVNNRHSKECHGYNEQFYLNGTEYQLNADTIGPKIFLWLNSPDFPNGGFINSSALLGITISDKNGLNSSGNSIGHDMELVIDGDITNKIKLNDYFQYDLGSYTTGSISYPLENLRKGKHTLVFRAWDVNGNSSSAFLTFNVSDELNSDYDINATNNPASTQTTFITTIPSEGMHTILTEVYDTAGRQIWKKQGEANNIRFHAEPWDMRDNSGRTINAGIYIFKATIKTPNGKKETKGKKMIVVKQ